MNELRHQYPVRLMAKVLKVSSSGFYAWLKRPPSQRAMRDEALAVHIRAAHKKSRETYGPVRLQRELACQGIRVGRDHIGRLRKALRLICVQRRKYKATTNSAHGLPVAQNLLEQNFSITEPGRVWGTDITYIATDEGWLYLAGIKDFASREIVGYAMDKRMTKELVRAALAKALRTRKPRPGCIHHSDRGSQYCALEYLKDVLAAGMTSSMSRKGNCYDNAPTESFWGCLKQELVYRRHFATRLEAMAAIQEYIEVFYNRVRISAALGFVAPSAYADLFYRERKTA